MKGERDRHDKDNRPQTGAEEVLKEFRDAELRLDDGEPTENDKEASDALRPSKPLQESVQKKRKADEPRPEERDR